MRGALGTAIGASARLLHPVERLHDRVRLLLELVLDGARRGGELETERDRARGGIDGQVLDKAALDNIHAKVGVHDSLQSFEHLRTGNGCGVYADCALTAVFVLERSAVQVKHVWERALRGQRCDPRGWATPHLAFARGCHCRRARGLCCHGWTANAQSAALGGL